jgi:hypothetical protein
MSRRKRAESPISLFSFQDIITCVTGILILVTLFLALEVVRRREGSPEHLARELTEEMRQAAEQTDAVAAALAENRRQIDELRTALAADDAELLQNVRYDSAMLQRQLRDLETLNRQIAHELAESTRKREVAALALAHLNKQDADRAADRLSLEQLTAQTQQKLEELRRLRAANRVLFSSAQRSAKSPWLVELSPRQVLAAEVGKRARPQSFPDVSGFLSWSKQRNRSAEYFVLLIKPSTIEDFYRADEGLERQGFDVGFDLLKDDQTAIDPESGAAP